VWARGVVVFQLPFKIPHAANGRPDGTLVKDSACRIGLCIRPQVSLQTPKGGVGRSNLVLQEGFTLSQPRDSECK